MGTIIGEQARTLAISLLLGSALALLYDLSRALRRRKRGSRVWDGVLDTVYCAALALSGLAFALRVGGGELRLYTLIAAALGAALWFLTISPLLYPMWEFWAKTLAAFLRLLWLPVERAGALQRKLHKTAKRLFLFFRRSLIMCSYQHSPLRFRQRAERNGAFRYGSRSGKTRKEEKRRQPADAAFDRSHAGADRLAAQKHAR